MADQVLALNAPWPLMLACMRAASPSLSIWRPEHSPLSHSSSRSLCLLSHSLPAPERVRHGKRAELPTAARFFLFLHPDSPSSARPKPSASIASSLASLPRTTVFAMDASQAEARVTTA